MTPSLFLPLTDMTACVGYSGGRMLDLYAPALQPLAPALVEDDVQYALDRLTQAGIETFPVDFTQEPTSLAFAPVFSPQSLERNFTIESKSDDASVVLRVRKPHDAQLDAAFLDAWQLYLEKYNAHRNHGVYTRFVAWLRQSSS